MFRGWGLIEGKNQNGFILLKDDQRRTTCFRLFLGVEKERERCKCEIEAESKLEREIYRERQRQKASE